MRVDRKAFTEAMRAMNTVASPKATLPILSHALFAPTPDVLTLQSTDLEVGISISIMAEDSDYSPVKMYPVKLVLNIVRNLPKNVTSITINTNEDTIAGISVTSLPPDDFPPVKMVDSSPISVPGLVSAIEKVAPAMSMDETRYTLNGVLLDSTAVAATDGHRLHVADLTWEKPEDLAYNIIIARSGVETLLSKSVRKTALDSIAIETYPTGGYRVGFELSNGFITVRCIDGTFPNYHGVIPKRDFVLTVTTPKKSLIDAVKAAVAVSSERNKPIDLIFNKDLTVFAENENAKCSFDVPGAQIDYHAKPDAWNTIGLNGYYMFDALEAVPGDNVVIKAKSHLDPIKIPAKGLDIIIMPMRTKQHLKETESVEGVVPIEVSA